jgi:hypothetical protein
VDVFTQKYAPDAPRLIEQEAQQKMSKIRIRVHRAVSNGKAFETAFFVEVQQAKKAASPSRRVVKMVATKRVVAGKGKLALGRKSG